MKSMANVATKKKQSDASSKQSSDDRATRSEKVLDFTKAGDECFKKGRFKQACRNFDEAAYFVLPLTFEEA